MFARTERLLLRPGWQEDAEALHGAMADQAIVRNLATAPWPYRLEDARAFLARQNGVDEPSFLLFRRTAGAPRLVGGAGLGRTPDGDVELGYWVARPYWGLGYATEAARAVIDLARDSLRLKRITAGHFLDNPASGRVLEKIGFRSTGRVVVRHSAGRGKAMPGRELALDGDDAVADAACPRDLQSYREMMAA